LEGQTIHFVLFRLENVPALQLVQRVVASGSEYVPRTHLEQKCMFNDRFINNSYDFVMLPKISWIISTKYPGRQLKLTFN
jgi:hypothetical protein